MSIQKQNQELQENINSTNIKNSQLTKEYDLFFYKVESLKDDYQELEEKYNRLQKDFVKKSHVGFRNLVSIWRIEFASSV